jgi:general secretion pathway protein N
VRISYLIGLAAGAYALGLVAMAPATLIDSRLQHASEGRLRLAEAHGTVWSGDGQLEIRDAYGRSGIAKHTAWQFRPAQLLRGKFLYEVALDHAIRPFPVALTPSHIEIADADISLPAAVVGLAVARLATLELSGDLMLQVKRLALARGSIQGNATLQWRSAGSALTRVSPLGDYEVRAEGDGASVRASLRTLQGPLQLDGGASWKAGSNPEFLGTARVPPQHQQQLSPLLRLIAVERGDGLFALQLK